MLCRSPLLEEFLDHAQDLGLGVGAQAIVGLLGGGAPGEVALLLLDDLDGEFTERDALAQVVVDDPQRRARVEDLLVDLVDLVAVAFAHEFQYFDDVLPNLAPDRPSPLHSTWSWKVHFKNFMGNFTV